MLPLTPIHHQRGPVCACNVRLPGPPQRQPWVYAWDPSLPISLSSPAPMYRLRPPVYTRRIHISPGEHAPPPNVSHYQPLFPGSPVHVQREAIHRDWARSARHSQPVERRTSTAEAPRGASSLSSPHVELLCMHKEDTTHGAADCEFEVEEPIIPQSNNTWQLCPPPACTVTATAGTQQPSAPRHHIHLLNTPLRCTSHLPSRVGQQPCQEI